MRMSFKDDMDDFTNSPLDDMVEGEAEGQFLHTHTMRNGFSRVYVPLHKSTAKT